MGFAENFDNISGAQPDLKVKISGEAVAVSKLWNALAKAVGRYGGQATIGKVNEVLKLEGEISFPTTSDRAKFTSARRDFMQPFRYDRFTMTGGFFEVSGVR